MVPAHPPCTFISLGSSLSRIRNQPPERSCYAEIKSQPASDGEREKERKEEGKMKRKMKGKKKKTKWRMR